MIVVIIAGGSGTRLWPLSTHSFPKHLLSITNERSLLQNTFDRVQQIAKTDKIFVISEASHAEHVHNQLDTLPKDNVLIEPGRRGTASCVAWALAEVKKRKLDAEPILFLWADSLIRDVKGFAASALKAGAVASSQKTIVFIGAEPTYASTGMGYMHKGAYVDGWTDVYQLSGFKEKPDKKTASKYMQSGEYLWNMGYLVGTLEVFERMFDKYSKEMKTRYTALVEANDTKEAYLKLESEAIDYAFSEKIENALVIPGTFDWMDVGSFSDLHSVSELDEAENYVKGEKLEVLETSNSYIQNLSETPLAVIGLDNVVVVATDHGVLVTNKNYSQKVGDVAKKLQS